MEQIGCLFSLNANFYSVDYGFRMSMPLYAVWVLSSLYAIMEARGHGVGKQKEAPIQQEPVVILTGAHVQD
jgi:hypothetical protein